MAASCGRLFGYLCIDRSCITWFHLCDGIGHCPDSSDEINCVWCNPNAFWCQNGKCAPHSHRCNGIDDCGDGSDEILCESCKNSSFHCANEKCVQSTVRCDSSDQCGDNSDEKNCPSCGFKGFHCGDRTCVRQLDRCDGIRHCPDNSDEINCASCGTSGFLCTDRTCIRQLDRCDGIRHCPDISDEINCVECSGDSFLCSNKRCIRNRQMCNGQDDCQDNSDEVNCVNCSGDSFKCNNKRCIGNELRCDGQDDCQDNSDERALHIDIHTNPSYICSTLPCYVDNNSIKVIAAAPGTICGSGKSNSMQYTSSICTSLSCTIPGKETCELYLAAAGTKCGEGKVERSHPSVRDVQFSPDDTYEDVHLELRLVQKTERNGEMGSNKQGQEMKDNADQYVYPDGSEEILTYNDEITSVLTQTDLRENHGEGASSQLKDADVTNFVTPGLYHNMYHCPDVSEGEVTNNDYNVPVQRSNSDYICPVDHVHTGDWNLETQKVVKKNTWPERTGKWDISVPKPTGKVQSSWSDEPRRVKQGQGTDHITESTRCYTASIDGQLCCRGLDTDYITPVDGVEIYTDGQLCCRGLDIDYITPVDGVDIYTDVQLCRSELDTGYITPVDRVDIYMDTHPQNIFPIESASLFKNSSINY
ncbi:hypothetical protein Btru_012802 [Bulinus truncatus]|nr:hypothetical protein Btru_012802 [Bulinus truncatus]